MADTYDFTPIEDKYGLPHGYLARLRQIESNNGKDTYNKSSGAAGDFQFIPGTARQYGLNDPYDTMAAADAAARLAQDNRVRLQQAGIDNPTGAQLYLAHQQGAGGAIKLLQGQGSAGDAVGHSAVSLNGGDPNNSGQSFANMVMAKYNNAGASQPQTAQPNGGILAQPQTTQPGGGILNFAQALAPGQQGQGGGLLTGALGLPGLVRPAGQQQPGAAPQIPTVAMPQAPMMPALQQAQIQYYRPRLLQG